MIQPGVAGVAAVPGPATLLDAWDACARLGPVERALRLLLAGGSSSASDLADLTIGERNAALLDLREAWFGSRIEAVADCPRCGAGLELGFGTADLRAPGPGRRDPVDVEAEGHHVTVRALTSRDLAEASASGDVGEVRMALLARCILTASRRGEVVDAADLPDSVVDRVAEAVGHADPQSHVELSMTCVGCGHEWTEAFDIAALLWSDVDGWAQRTLREVHELARAYGWTEREALSLTSRRRDSYLRLLHDG